ncbi:MAG: polysaccharide biosynthesis/export family protein [Prevotella sp.]|jgi:polysaccharide export outer membrane protein|nr:polysaccharide biosynthesis/export family protein [Prevotella sp.]
MMTNTYKKRLSNLLLLAGVVGMFASCISPKETNLLQPGKEPYYSVRPFEDYRLRANDEIYCNISTTNVEFLEEFKQAYSGIVSAEGTSGQSYYIIDKDGSITIPFFGNIKIEGLTIPEAEKAIQRVMQASFRDANVRVRLRNNMFYIISGSRNGVYTIFKDNMTIYQAIALTGNITSDIDLSYVQIIRKDRDGKDIVKTFNLKTESVIESEYYYIRPNDVIHYKTNSNSFFRVNSFTELFSTILTPITFLLTMYAWRNNIIN